MYSLRQQTERADQSPANFVLVVCKQAMYGCAKLGLVFEYRPEYRMITVCFYVVK